MDKDYSKHLINEDPIFFLPTLANTLGLNEAILLQKIHGWLQCKPHDAVGRSWIYNTYKSWQEQLPFMSESTIKRTIKNLVDKEILIMGNFNKNKFDKTNWYSIDYDKLDQIDTIDGVKMTYGECQNDPLRLGQNDTTNTNISNNNYNNKEIYKENFKNETTEDRFNKLWDIFPRKEGKANAFKKYQRICKNVDDETIRNGILKYTKYIQENKIEKKYIKQGATWFNGECWNDEYNLGGDTSASGYSRI